MHDQLTQVSDGLQPTSDGLQPKSYGLQHNSKHERMCFLPSTMLEHGYFVQACWSFWPFDTGPHDLFHATLLAHVFLQSGYVFLCPQGLRINEQERHRPPAVPPAFWKHHPKDNANAVQEPYCDRNFIHIRGSSFNPRKPVFLVNQNPVQRNTMLDHQPFFFISIALATSSSKAAACSSDDKENRLSRPRVLAHPLLVVMCDKKRSR